MAKNPRNTKKTAKVTADRAEQLKASRVRAGKSKADTLTRMRQNKGVKHGTVRLGKSGKSYNVYDAKTGTWKKGVVKAAATKPKPKSNIKDKKASRIGGYTPGTKSQTLKNTGWWSTNRYPASYS